MAHTESLSLWEITIHLTFGRVHRPWMHPYISQAPDFHDFVAGKRRNVDLEAIYMDILRRGRYSTVRI